MLESSFYVVLLCGLFSLALLLNLNVNILRRLEVILIQVKHLSPPPVLDNLIISVWGGLLCHSRTIKVQQQQAYDFYRGKLLMAITLVWLGLPLQVSVSQPSHTVFRPARVCHCLQEEVNIRGTKAQLINTSST